MFTFDKDGNCIYTVDMPILRYDAVEEIRDEDGKVIGKRTVEKTHQAKQKIEKPEDKGWFKKLTFESIVLIRVPDTSDYSKIKPRLFLRTSEFDVEKYFTYNRCTHCETNGFGHKYHFARDMSPNNIMVLCWRVAYKYGKSSQLAQTIENRENQPSKWVKIISEKPISPQKALEWYQSKGVAEGTIPDPTLRMMLSGAEVI
jgi:hypothetical protein